MHYVDDDFVTIPDFLAALGWSEQKIHLFLNPREMSKLFRNPKILDRWESVLWSLNTFVRNCFVSSVEKIAEELREKDIENLEIVSSAIDKYLCTFNAVRNRPSKLSTETIQQIYLLSLSGSASRIAKEFGVSRKTVYLIKSGAIHSQILP